MQRCVKRWAIAAIVGVLLGTVLVVGTGAQGSLSNQVLALLSRTNSWIGQNTFYNLRVVDQAIPADTASRLYQNSGTLYWDGAEIGASGGGVGNHNLLSSTHPDTLAAAVVRGAVIVGNSTPKWDLVAPTSGYLQSDGVDTAFSTSGAALTNIPAANLTGTIAAISGVNLTSLNASNLGSGTVPLARLSGILNAQISASAAIAYSKLNLAGSVDLAADVTGVTPFANGGTGVSTAADDTVLISSGTAWIAKALSDCPSGGVSYTASSNSFGCNAIGGGAGSVTSVALSLPAILSVSGSPITSAGTLAVSLASQTQNLILASPNGSSGTPAFRAIVNADLPTSGVAAATYPKVTVNTRGIVTAASASIDLTADVSTTVLPRANGGTGVAVSGDDTVLVGSGSAWVAQTLPDCARTIQYTASTNAWSCGATLAYGTITSSAPLQVTATWNSGATAFTQFKVNVTDTSSLAASLLEDLQVGSTSKYAVRKDGAIIQAGIAFAALGTPANGTIVYCSDCTRADPCAAVGTGALAVRLNSVWKCD